MGEQQAEQGFEEIGIWNGKDAEYAKISGKFTHSGLNLLLQVSHGNCSRHAKTIGDNLLRKICALIAADEARHEAAYKKVCATE